MSGQPSLIGPLTVPRGWTLNRGSTVYGRRAFSIAAPLVWNTIPKLLLKSKNAENVAHLEQRLKHFIQEIFSLINYVSYITVGLEIFPILLIFFNN